MGKETKISQMIFLNKIVVNVRLFEIFTMSYIKKLFDFN